MPSQPDKKIEMWLPVNETKVTVVDGKVTVWDEMTMEKRLVKKPPGFVAAVNKAQEVSHALVD